MNKLAICVLLILSSCNKNNNIVELKREEKIIQKKTIMEDNKLPYTSEDIKKYFSQNKETGEYEIIIDNTKHSSKFSNTDISLPIKENDFEVVPFVGDTYVKLKTFNLRDNISGSIIIYKTLGDNNSNILNVQLNTFKNGKLKDQLLLDCRLMFEIEYYRTFFISKDEKIEITKYSVNNLDFNEEGDIIGKKEKPTVDKEKVIYGINHDGEFYRN